MLAQYTSTIAALLCILSTAQIAQAQMPSEYYVDIIAFASDFSGDDPEIIRRVLEMAVSNCAVAPSSAMPRCTTLQMHADETGGTRLAGLAALVIPDTTVLETAINPALAFMLFVTFLQVPIAELGRAFLRIRFLGTLMAMNFIAIPILVLGLIQFVPIDPMVRIGVLLVLLTPCIDYVVTFSHLGQADAKSLLAATPALLIAQMGLLPVYLRLFLGDDAHGLVQMAPFVHAFVWLIAVPLIGAGALQFVASRNAFAARLNGGLGLLPVPATALVLFVVVAAVVPQLNLALEGAMRALPIYLAFAVMAPALGWLVARFSRLDIPASRAIAFSAATRNSLVVLPLAFAIPNAMPLLPAIIVTQTLVELVSQLIYIRMIGRLGNRSATA